MRGRCCMNTGHDGGSGTSISPWTTFGSISGKRSPSTLRGSVSAGPILSGISVFKILQWTMNLCRVIHGMAAACRTGRSSGVPLRALHNALEPASRRSVQWRRRVQHVPALRHRRGVQLLEPERGVQLRAVSVPLRPPRHRVLRSVHVLLG